MHTAHQEGFLGGVRADLCWRYVDGEDCRCGGRRCERRHAAYHPPLLYYCIVILNRPLWHDYIGHDNRSGTDDCIPLRDRPRSPRASPSAEACDLCPTAR
eukprot:1183571-Prorocentrum_minimum.AAC.1